MKLVDFLSVHNFRDFHNDREDSKIVRIRSDVDMWFEFGMYDFYGEQQSINFIKSVINKKILEKEVTSVSYNDTAEVLEIYLI